MSLRQAAFSGTLPGRSLKTVRTPWFAGLQSSFVASVNSVATTATTSANAKSAWSQVLASASSDISLIAFAPQTNFGTEQAVLFDIAVGAAGSETAIVSDVAVGGFYFNGQPQILLPVRIPAGSRVSVRSQTATSGRGPSVSFSFYSTSDYARTPAALDAIGSSTATSLGTAMTGASGTWTQITSSTSQAYQALIVVPSYATPGSGPGNTRLTLGFGPAGSEREISSSAFSVGSAGIIMQAAIPEQLGPAGIAIPAGTRLAVRHNIASSPGRIQACVIGVPYA